MSEKSAPTRMSNAPKPAAKRLGRGLGALLGEMQREEPLVAGDNSAAGESQSAPVSATPDRGLAMLPVAAIEPHPEQPRRHFDEDALVELAASIAARGVIQPVIVRPMGGGRYQLVAGERRWRAAQRAQLHEIPALLRDLEERDVLALALIENIQREDLNPIEEARAYQRLGEHEGLSQAEIAELVDKSRSHVSNLQRLLSLPDSVIAHVEMGQLSMGHARALVGRDDAESLAEEAIAKNLSVREMEKRTRKAAAKIGGEGRRHAREPRDATGDADIMAVQNHLEEFLGLPVRINSDTDPRSGAVTIRYRSLDQLDLVCQRLTGGGI
ncbi:chromosome partitioning protein ParB [Croceicoccus estronivorus]|uniref:ParB/RepB/Spo0J family partition protein n=1 Tax=Croceicoccus estronivorus TaxID=1172626 RepID=UPI00082CA21C|nr:ParB/RepB/Spo0J family partition protein [Croceicoccus estronivorus]OCC24005.1 chromosome partitioning protein ParB [Croceicoccus estronivorus]